jgi:hypothetical protein
VSVKEFQCKQESLSMDGVEVVRHLDEEKFFGPYDQPNTKTH